MYAGAFGPDGGGGGALEPGVPELGACAARAETHVASDAEVIVVTEHAVANCAA